MQRRRFLLGLTQLQGLIGFKVVNMKADDDALYPPERVTLEFRVREQPEINEANVGLSIRGSGYQKKYPGGVVSVNGVELKEAPLSSQGVWYKATMPTAKQYDLTFTFGDRSGGITYRLASRVFRPRLPTEIVRGKGLVIEFAGAPLRGDARPSLTIEPEKKTNPRWFRWTPQVDADTLILAASELTMVPLGAASLGATLFIDDAQGQVRASLTIVYRKRVAVVD